MLDSTMVGTISVVPMSLRKKMDEHLASWGVAWMEIKLNGLDTIKPITEKMGKIPDYPLVDMDFSFVIPKTTRYRDVAKNLSLFHHPLLKHIRYVGRFEGDVVGPDSRSITIRTVIGDDQRTLVDEDTNHFQSAMETHLKKIGYKMR